MKILHIVSSMKLGGIEALVFSLMKADAQNIYVFAIHGSKESTFNKWPALAQYSDHFIFANKKTGFRYQVAKLLKKTCQKYSISIVHSHHIGPLIYASLAVRSMKSVKQVHTQHDIWHLKERKQWFIEYFILKIRRKIKLVAISNTIYNELKRIYPRKKISLIYNGIDTDRFKPENKDAARTLLKLPSYAIILAYSGRLEEIKGPIYLLQALAKLPKTYYLVIAGTGSLLNSLQKEVELLGLTSRIKFLGRVDEIELVYQASDLFCLPSVNEGLPLSILEAQSCDLPTICSNVGSCSEGIDPESGLLVPPKDPKAIVSACLDLESSTKHPREFILKRFSLATMIEKYRQIYEE